MAENIRNPLVLRMTESEREYLGLERIELRKRDVLARIDESQPHYIFMERGLVSIVVAMSDDRSCTIGHVCPPGMVGVSSFFLTDRSTANYVVILPGEGLRVPRERLRQVVRHNPDLTALFRELVQAAWVVCGQASACNRLHDFEPRLCTWLMLASIAIEADEIPVNQTEVARRLGVSRNQMRRVATTLTAAGLLQLLPTRIRLVDKAGIEANACECYRAMTTRFSQIFTNARNKFDFSVNDAPHVSRTERKPIVRF